MISIFKSSEDFDYAANSRLLRQHYGLMRQLFPDSRIEFFYHRKARERAGFFILRVFGAPRDCFLQTAADFAAEMSFEILDQSRAKLFFRRSAQMTARR